MVPGVSLNQIEMIFKKYKYGTQYGKGVLQKVLLIFKTDDDEHVWLITEAEKVKEGTKRDVEFYGYKLHKDGSADRTAVRLSVLCHGDIYFGSTVKAIVPKEIQLVSDYMEERKKNGI